MNLFYCCYVYCNIRIFCRFFFCHRFFCPALSLSHSLSFSSTSGGLFHCLLLSARISAVTTHHQFSPPSSARVSRSFFSKAWNSHTRTETSFAVSSNFLFRWQISAKKKDAATAERNSLHLIRSLSPLSSLSSLSSLFFLSKLLGRASAVCERDTRCKWNHVAAIAAAVVVYLGFRPVFAFSCQHICLFVSLSPFRLLLCCSPFSSFFSRG